MAKIKEASERIFGNIFVCRKCKHKQRAKSGKIRAKQIVCRKCACRDFRPKTKEKRVIK